jgi:glycosyltransferase involved in cell wall biosynthesis
MRIAIVSDVLGEGNNGTSITAQRLIKSLKERGHTVNVIAPNLPEGEGNYSLKNINFHIFNDYVAKVGVEIAKVDKDVIRDGIKDVDIVHIMLPFPVGIAALKIAKELGKPVTAGFHCQAENLSSHIFLKNVKPANDAVYALFRDKFYEKVDAIHCPTEFIKDVIEAHGYTKPKYVISNGVAEEYVCKEVERPDFIKDKFAILTVGRYGKEKQHYVLIDAIKKSKHESQIQLICAGGGPLKSKLEKQSEDLTNKPVFSFFECQELVKLFNSCDLYVHPADVELEGIACIEAITCGMVPLVSNSPRCATKYFALTDDNIFECNDSDDLAKKIDYLIDNPQRLKELKELYIPMRGAFKLSHSIDLMEGMFADAIKANDKAKCTVDE